MSPTLLYRKLVEPLMVAAFLTAAFAPASTARAQTAAPPLPPDTFDLRGAEVPAATPSLGQVAPETDLPDAAPAPTDNDQPNFGKPRKPVKQYGPKKTDILHPLPPLETYPTAPDARLAKRRGGPPADTRPPAPPVAVIPRPEPRHLPPADPEPFAPVGVDLGGLRLKPYVESDFGYDTNPDQANGKVKGSTFIQEEGGASFQSDWSNHELKGDLKGGYDDFFTDHNADRPYGNGTVDGRIDVTRDTTINLEGRFDVETQRPGSPEVSAAVVGRPLISTYGGTGGVTEQFGRLALSLRGTVDRTDEEDAKLSDGTIQALSLEDYTAYGLRGRAAYEITPGVTPFVEAFGDYRQHDNTVDLSGYDRNSTGEGAIAGSTFELSRKFTGSVDTGYEDRTYADRRLPDLRGPLVDGQLAWSATPLTTLTFRAATSLNETDVAAASGAISRSLSLELSHELFRNLKLTGSLGYTNTDYTGVKLIEDTYDAGLKAEYSLTRSLVVRGSFTYERLKSTITGEDYTQNVFMLGLRLQR